ncbi:sulfur oxidation protein SoxZ [Roseibium sp. TrichSKD4]|nr:sulfur oxidation protein SoxZ [Roseibium sp. TrichSKD4]
MEPMTTSSSLSAFAKTFTSAFAILSVTLIALPNSVAASDTRPNPLSSEGSWSDLKEDILGDLQPILSDGSLDLEAPYRAHDAATVPVVLKQSSPLAPMIDKALLIVDENPAPVAAEMTFGPAMHPINMEMRIRVNQYSNVRLVAETETGPVMAGRFVKASGGCSAPATKDPEVALSTMGEIRAKSFGPQAGDSSQRREAQIMIRHPNYSGLQRDQVTHLFINAHFINHVEVKQGDQTLFTVEGGISLSENPVFRFAYTDDGSKDFVISAEDTEGNTWRKVIAKDGSSS